MATIGELTAILGADIRGFDAAMKRAGDRIQKLGNTFSNIGGQLTRTVTLPLAAIGVAAIKASADWETAMVNVAKTVDAPAAKIKELGDRFVALSERIPASSVALAEVGAAAGQLGIETQNIFGFTKTMIALGVATNLSATEAATALARLANITQLPQDQFDRLGATVVALGNNLATTEAEIVNMGLRIAGAGAQVGLTQAQILGLAGALSSVGIRAEAGGTAISRVMIDMASAVEQGGEKLEQFASVAGTTASEFASQFRTDAAGAVVDFIEGLGKLDEQGKSLFGTLEQLGFADIRVRDALLRASGAGDLMRRSLEIGSTAFRENTALTDEASKFYDRLAGRLGALRNKIGNVAAEFGDTLRPAIDAAIGAVSRALDVARNLITAFGQLSPETRKLAVGITALVAVLGPLAFAVGVVLTLFGSVIATMSAVVIAMGAVGAVVLGIKQNWFGMGEVAIKVWDGILETIQTFVNTVGPIWRDFINFQVSLWVGLGNAWAVIIADLAPSMIEAFKKMEPTAIRVLTGIANSFSFIGKMARDVATNIKFMFGVAFGHDADTGTESEAESLGSRVAEAFLRGFSRDYVAVFFAVVKEGIDRAREAIASILERLRGLLGAANADVLALQDVLEDLADIDIPEPDENTGVGKFSREIKDLLEETGVEGGRLLIQGIMNGMQDFGQRLKSFIASFIEEFIIFKFKSVLGIFSPSRVFAGFGQEMVRGLQMGMNSMMADLAQTSAAVAQVSMGPVAQAASQGPMFNVTADFSKIPAPLTPREAALSAGFQDVIREVILQLEQGGFRIA